VAPPSPSPAPPVPTRPEREVLRFVLEHGQLLPWQQDILAIIREEALYFVPQAQTKIMNEGWASFWHTTLMTRELLEDSEVVDYADHHSGTVAMRPGQLNPYKLGIELFRHIEYRWDNGRFGKDWLDCDDLVARRDWHRPTALGRSKIFEVRRTHNDLTFIDTFLTEDFVREQGLFTTTFDKKANHWVVDSREFAAVKQRLLSMLSNRGNPRIEVLDANHANRGELVLQHQHEGADLQLDQAERTLRNLVQLWGRPVHLLTTVDGRTGRLSHDGQSFKSDTIRLPKQT
jgi:stage V sporulation protein R